MSREATAPPLEAGMGKVWEAIQTWKRLDKCLGKVREGKVLHGKTLGRVWEHVLFIVTVAGRRISERSGEKMGA